jgi:Spy/CpxP family protein refolding chaperone
MKKLLALSFVACLFAVTTMAQINQSADTTKKMDRRGGRGEVRGKGRSNDINITPEQKAKMEAIRKENKVKREQERAAQQAKINEVLTPEQRAKREEMEKQRAERKSSKVKGNEKHDEHEMDNDDKDDDQEKGKKGKHKDNRYGDKHEKGKKMNHTDNRNGEKHKKGKK